MLNNRQMLQRKIANGLATRDEITKFKFMNNFQWLSLVVSAFPWIFAGVCTGALISLVGQSVFYGAMLAIGYPGNVSEYLEWLAQSTLMVSSLTTYESYKLYYDR
ncbi:hypothetical protein GCM10009425_41190 [Pseudomonas asuensis]|uniref:Uncharacterized protein n=1 Tax=Pseudomonas asuensis TaxID=1825787 RepID=A0ABQ2H379_9PSED|nr:hypothetical protein [Pseudomonas asuensis]GGM26287.1 hypothetical protein GCM10009425_41190 [Pseudomonas asuensis]